MTPHDLVNAIFEGGGALFLCLNVRRLLKDKSVKGVSLLTTSWWTAWGFWNVYFYRAVSCSASFYAGIAVVVVNAVWLGLAVYYARQTRPRVAKGEALDLMGEVLGVKRMRGEGDRAFRSRLHDFACSLAGCP